MQIWLAKGIKTPIIRRTQRRAVVEKKKDSGASLFFAL